MNYFIITVILICIVLYGCSGSWKPQPNTDRDLPWCDKNTRTLLELKKSTAPFSSTGYQMHMRWVTPKNRKNPAIYGWSIDDFLVENKILDQWPKSGSYVSSGKATKQLIRAPYIFKIISVEPLIVILRKQQDQDGKTYRGDLLVSQHLTTYFYYGTKFLYDPESLWFSPDLKQLPIPLKLEAGSEVNIQLINPAA
jgi:hypothetical protein